MDSWALLSDPRTIKVGPERAQSIDDSPLCVRSNVTRAADYTILLAGQSGLIVGPRAHFWTTPLRDPSGLWADH
jgi:hypothetical protein